MQVTVVEDEKLSYISLFFWKSTRQIIIEIHVRCDVRMPNDIEEGNGLQDIYI